jgi:hypothetical protein
LIALQYGWYPYPGIYSFPYICEKPQVLYACNESIPPPALPVPLCLPHDNDTVFCPDPNPGGSCYFYFSTAATFANAQAKCKSVFNGNLISYGSELEQRMIETRFKVSWCPPSKCTLSKPQQLQLAAAHAAVPFPFPAPPQNTFGLPYQYWLGLTYSNNTYLYEWFDGEDAGSGPPSEHPYSHFVYNFQDLKGLYPAWTCTGALQSTAYDM